MRFASRIEVDDADLVTEANWKLPILAGSLRFLLYKVFILKNIAKMLLLLCSPLGDRSRGVDNACFSIEFFYLSSASWGREISVRWRKER